MKKDMFFLCLLCAAGMLPAQDLPSDTAVWHLQMEEAVVVSNRVGNKTPMANSRIVREDIRKTNAASNIPYVLSLTPSVVSVSENGTAAGNTTLRIRGSSSSRINVTLNGIPLNDAESQEVFWVNLPALSYSLQQIQIQRGVGSSANGPAAFGGTLNMQSLINAKDPYAEASMGVGSYHTFESSLAAGTGLLKSGLSFDMRYSKVLGDGYVRNGKIAHQSFFSSLSYRTAKDLLRLNYILGDQRTGITWEGASPLQIEADRRFNPAGMYLDEVGNVRYYDNETDNYRQNILQLLYTRDLSKGWTFHANMAYTLGEGYYENYKYDRKFSKYGLDPQVMEGTVFHSSDFITQQKMVNDYYVSTLNLRYQSDRFSLLTGGMYSLYMGDHFGELPWIKHNAGIVSGYRWYFNDGKKQDVNYFVKGEWNFLPSWTFFGDLQYRHVSYLMEGHDNDLANLSQRNFWNFVNPKTGVFFRPDAHREAWFSVSVSHREPARADLKDATKYGNQHDIRPEKLTDFELGYQYSAPKASFSINGYYMLYRDQLAATGKLSSTGYALMENIEDSYRLGLELSGGIRVFPWVSLDGNLTLSRNRIKDYTGWIDQYDSPDYENQLPQIPVNKPNSSLSFSPEVVGAGMLTFYPLEAVSFGLTTKYVGSQFYDNLSNPENQIPAYSVSNLHFSYQCSLRQHSRMEFQIFVNNLFNNEYIANAWVYTVRFADGSPESTERGFFVQAPRNFMARMTVSF